MPRTPLNIFISAALFCGSLVSTTNGDSAAGSRELWRYCQVIGGKDDQMTTQEIPKLVPAGLRLHDLAPGESFAIPLSGNSMEPDYRDGDRVIFSVVALPNAHSAIGCDCMFWRDDGQATFKRFAAIQKGTFILHALNQKAFPEPLNVKATKLRLLAIARYIYREAPAANAGKKSGTPETSTAAHLGGQSSKRKAIATAA